MKTTQASQEERQAWRNLDESIKRNRQSTADLDKWIKAHDKTPPAPPLFDTTEQKDGCALALLPLVVALLATVAQIV